MSKRPLSLIFLFSLLPLSLGAQDPGQGVVLPRGYQEILLGDSMDVVKEKLLSHRDFRYRGEAEVQLLEREGVQVIETEGVFFIDRAFFQFEEDLLVGITLMMNQDQLDHYSFFSQFYEKYGRPGDMNPQKARWEDQEVYLVLEKPLTIKYLDKPSILAALDQENEDRSIMEITRENYVEQF
jgi:hypothetical protein